MNFYNEEYHEHIVSKLGRAFMMQGFINTEDRKITYPSKKNIEELTALMVCGFFPGFFDDPLLRSDRVFHSVETMIMKIRDCLDVEISRALNVQQTQLSRKSPEHKEHELNQHEISKKTSNIVKAFLDSIAKIREVICFDIKAAMIGDPAAESEEEIILAYPFIPTLIAYRLAHSLHQANVPLIPRIMTEWGHKMSGLDIHPAAKIGKGFFCDHATMTTIGATCEIGDNVRLYQGVGLIAKSLSLDKISDLRTNQTRRHPKIESNTTIYTNAVIMGPVTIGRNCTIGANVFLAEDLEDSFSVWVDPKVGQTKSPKPPKKEDPRDVSPSGLG